MRANEFIVESMKEFSPEQLAAIPGMQKIPGLDNSNPYHMWRFIVAAGALDGKGNDKHRKVQSDYPRMHYSALDGPANYGRLRSSYQLSPNALQCF